MKIRLKDETPKQKSHYSMPKPLHQEVEHYVEDLLNQIIIKLFITSSSSKGKRWVNQVVLRPQSFKQQDLEFKNIT